jgi:tRNA nucleotidyltransferase (CCA-adding enzyme)
MEIYLVGGALRDALLGRAVHDRDYVVIGATPELFASRFPAARRLGRSRTFILAGEEYTLSRAPHILADLATRDLTINALARDGEGRLHSLPGALADLERRVLRPVHPENFLHDPLRTYRAARMAALLPDFACHPLLAEAMGATVSGGLLAGIAAERVGREVRRACAAPRPGRFLEQLAEVRAFDPWLSELAAAAHVPAGPSPHHDGSLLAHLVALCDQVAGDPTLVWMAICHDLGKGLTPRAHWPRHHGHDRAGEPLARRLGERLRLPCRLIDAGAAAARWHMLAGRYAELRPATRVALLTALRRGGLLPLLFRLAAADQAVDHLARAVADLERLLAVRLPAHHRSLGRRSGALLHQLRCQALAGPPPVRPTAPLAPF